VDDTVFHLLQAIDQELLQLTFTASNGNRTNLAVDGRGELGGWYTAGTGWRAEYSRQRFVNDFPDLA
jgi:hypothetical protein